MIEHLVLFKFKADAPAGQLEETATALRSLKTQVPGVVDLSVGRNFSARSQGYELGLTVRLEDKAALDGYAVHPAHVDVVARFVKPHLESLIAVDYEF